MSSTRYYKDPGYAAKLSLSWLPIDNGHFYVGEVGKGIWYSVGQTLGLVAAVSAFLNSQSRAKQNVRPIWTDGMVASAAGGGLAYLALKVLSAYDSAEGARRYNAEQEKLHGDKGKQGWRLDTDGRNVFLTKRWGK